MGSKELLLTKNTKAEICHCSNGSRGLDVSRLLLLEDGNIPSYGIIVLNRPITHNETYLIKLWKNAKITLTADGGTDRWDAFLGQLDHGIQQTLEPPDLITGDFDSISDRVLEKYRNKGSKIVHTPNQDATDFTKALMEMNLYCLEKHITLDAVVAITKTSGRMDQLMANVNTLFLCRERELLGSGRPEVCLMSDDSVSWLLGCGEHVINIPEKIRVSGNSWCSLVPVGERCAAVTTAGLKWNLANQALKFGGLVSTSNTYDGTPTVRIKCSHALLWSMKIKALFV